MQDVIINWTSMSIKDKAKFLSRECAELATELYRARDVKGLEVINKNLSAVAEYAENMIYEVEVDQKREYINTTLAELQRQASEKGIDQSLAEDIDRLSKEVWDYVHTAETPEDYDEADETAIANVQAAIIQEEQLAEEGWTKLDI